MKNIHIAITFLLFTNFSFAQELAVKFTVNSFIYAKIDNPMEIVGCVNFDEIEVTCQGATIEKNENHKFNLKAKKEGVAYITIFNKKSKSTQTIPVGIRPFPTPTVYLNRNYDGLSEKIALQRSTRLRTENNELVCWNVSEVIIFDLTVIHSNKVHNFKDQKNKFSKDMKALFATLTTGDFVVFYNIRFKVLGDEDLILNDLVYKIK